MPSKSQKDTKVKPSRFLGDKVPKTGGPSPEQAIAKALSLGDELFQSYQGWVVDDLQALWEECKSIDPKGLDAKSQITKIYDMSHDLRGHGSSFGFPLVSLLGDSLCKYIEGRNTFDQRILDIIKLHIHAMKAVFSQGLKGDQPKLANQLNELLTSLRSQ